MPRGTGVPRGRGEGMSSVGTPPSPIWTRQPGELDGRVRRLAPGVRRPENEQRGKAACPHVPWKEMVRMKRLVGTRCSALAASVVVTLGAVVGSTVLASGGG